MQQLAGSFFLPPVGTVVGVGAGMLVSTAINYKFGNPPKSLVDHTKTVVKKGVKAVGNLIGKGLKKIFG